MQMSGNPLDGYREFDPEIIECYKNLEKSTYNEGALSLKVKLLMAMAIDAEHGTVPGATALGKRALNAGATKEEIIEALRVAYQIGGNKALFTSALVLQNLFKQAPSR
jgi:alkylhydroperoxidase/carboxymuconolactone decarboxylase family protein YurZ